MKDLNQSYNETLKIGQSHRDVFDWPDALAVLKKAQEELLELKEAIEVKRRKDIFEETSDLVFTIVQCLRHLDIDLKNSLDFANEKFNLRFKKMNELIATDQKELGKLTLNEAESYWTKSKKATQNQLSEILNSTLDSTLNSTLNSTLE